MIYVNARYRSYGKGGFARYSDEVVARLPAVRVLEPPRYATSPLRGRVWEQTVLASHTRDGVLFSPANSGPLRHPRHVATIHDVLALQRPDLVSPSFATLQRRFLPPLAHGCRRVIVVSEAVADAVVEHCSLPRGRVTCIPPGVSPVFAPRDQSDARRRLGLHPGRPVVGAVVSSAPRKNAATTLGVLATVCGRVGGCQAVVAGFDEPGHIFGPNSRPTDDSIVDLGSVDDETMAEFYNSLDVFVCLSDGEGFGLPPLEAAACGAAVVSTAVPSVVEHLQEGVVLVDGPSEAVTAMVGLLQSGERRGELVATSADTVSLLTWERTANAVAEILHEVEGAAS